MINKPKATVLADKIKRAHDYWVDNALPYPIQFPIPETNTAGALEDGIECFTLSKDDMEIIIAAPQQSGRPASSNALPDIGVEGKYSYDGVVFDGVVTAHVEGWLEIKLKVDGSHATIRPSRFLALQEQLAGRDPNAAWNTRQPDPQVTALVEAFKGLLDIVVTTDRRNAKGVGIARAALSAWEKSNG